MNNPTFSDDYIDSILDRLEYFEEYVQAGLGNEIKLGPYTVFTGSSFTPTPTPPGRRDVEDGEVFTNCSEGASASTPEEEAVLESTHSTQGMCHYRDQPTPTLVLQQRLLPFLKPFLSSSSAAERRLLHFWVTAASSIMTCIDHPDNPFRQVVIPIALEAAASSHKLPGHAALLHIIYAFAGFHLAQLNQSDQNSKEIATKHYHAGLRHLRKSLTQDPHQQYDAILAVIILMISIDTLNGQSGQWQIHMRGAREWLREIGSVWVNHAYGHVMYQMFECLEIMGYTQTPHLQLPSNLMYEQEPNIDNPFSATSDVNDNPYCLDRFFGVTKPVLKLIKDINRLLGSDPTREELAIIEHEILLANPSTLLFPGPKEIEQITRHHACALYYSAVIYYQRSILRRPLNEIQHLVEQSLYHLEAYTKHTEHKLVVGLIWPVCVTACEAEDRELRLRCVEIVDRKARHGIGAIAQLKEVVLEVWGRRDGSDCGQNILWQDVMKDLGIDILLC